jgi:hypothetical protein
MSDYVKSLRPIKPEHYFPTGKREILARSLGNGALVAVWTGKWTADAFEVSEETHTRWLGEV